MRRLILCTAIMAILATIGCAQQPGTSLIENGGFEEGQTAWERIWGRPDIVSEGAHSGQKCLKVTGGGGLQTKMIPHEDRFIHLSVWMKTEDVVRGERPFDRATCQYQWLDEEGKELDHGDFGQTVGTTDWTKYETTVNALEKPKAKYLRVKLFNWNTPSGTSYWDDCVVEVAQMPEAYVKVPPLHEVEDDRPVVWPMPDVTRPDLSSVTHDTGAITCIMPADGSGPVIELAHGHGPKITEVNNAVLQSTGTDCIGDDPPISGFDWDRGYAMRYRRAKSFEPDAFPAGEEYTEVFRGSPIAYNFSRIWLPHDVSNESVSGAVRIEGTIDRVIYFDGNTPVQADADGAQFTLHGTTTKPYVILTDADDTAGVILYHPVPPEIRRWYIEDYIVEHELPATVNVEATDSGVELSYSYPEFSTDEDGYCHSFDFYTFAMPYTGPAADAVMKIQPREDRSLLDDVHPFTADTPRGLWTYDMPHGGMARLFRMSRYFPREFSSWLRGNAEWRHEDGFAWGGMTEQMKGIRVDPTADRPIIRDHAFRLHTFFVERANEKGAPGGLRMWRQKGARMEEGRDYYGQMFCMYWEFRLGEFRKLLNESEILTAQENEQFYQDLQKAKNLYGPEHEGSWTVELPEGLWFRYSDLGQGPENWFVMNTHVVSVGNCGEFALIARDMRHEDDYEYWKDLFHGGIDGLLWVTNQDWIWADYDENQLLYAKGGRGPRGYHRWITSSMLPRAGYATGEMEGYRLDEILALEKRLMRADLMQDHPNWLDHPQKFVQWAEQTLQEQDR